MAWTEQPKCKCGDLAIMYIPEARLPVCYSCNKKYYVDKLKKELGLV